MKEPKATIKLLIQGGSANPGPPIGPTLAPHGINLQEFCQAFNEQTKDRKGELLTVVLNIYEDRSFDFEIKKAPVSYYIKKELNLEKGAKEPGSEVVGKLTKEQILKIAEEKKEDFNTDDLDQIIKMIIGTARSMGIEVENGQ